MNSSGQYDVERLNEKNIADVEKLHIAVYGESPGAGFYPAKYDTSFTAVKYIGYIAYDKQQNPIAFYAVIPCFIRFDDKIELSAQSADTMTHPQHRNKGLFVELALLTFQLCQSTGIQFVFGFPNQNSLPGFVNKLGWQMTERLDCFIIPCAVFSWKRFLGKFLVLKNWYSRRQLKVLKKYLQPQQGTPNSVFDDGFAGVYRDHHYFKYKAYTGTYVIKISNSTLWIKISGVLLIGDMIVKPKDFIAMMDKVKKLAHKMGIKEIHFHASPGTTLHNFFAANFTSIPSFPVIFKDFSGDTPIGKIKFTSADIDTF